jgi:hypothetical protein
MLTSIPTGILTGIPTGILTGIPTGIPTVTTFHNDLSGITAFALVTLHSGERWLCLSEDT